MRDLEKSLQDQLNAFEYGQDLESILQGLPEDAEDLASLVQLASQIKTIPHPEPSPAQAAQQQQRVMAAARQTFAKRKTGWSWLRANWAMAGSFAGALVLAIAFIVMAGIGWFSIWTTVEVTEATGVVQVVSQSHPESWRTIQPGERVRSPSRIRTSADSTASLRFSDGSLVNIGSQTDLSLEKLERGWGERISIVLIQNAGEAQHVVAPQASNSTYEVWTPSGTASVKGTDFNVIVEQSTGNAIFSVNAGSVWVESGKETVLVESGKTTTTRPNQAPEEPAYGFQINGILSAWDEDAIVIGSIPLNVSDSMIVGVEPTIGKTARAVGHIDDAGAWWVDLLTSSDGAFQATFTGILEATGDGIWQISGTSVLIDANTMLSGEMMIGTLVKVDFIVLEEGQYPATHIQQLDADEIQVTPAPSRSVTTTMTPDLTSTAAHILMLTPEASPTATVSPTVPTATAIQDTPTKTDTAEATSTKTATQAAVTSIIISRTPTSTHKPTRTVTRTATGTSSAPATTTPTHTATQLLPATSTPTSTRTPTRTASPTATTTSVGTFTPTPIQTRTSTPSQTRTATSSWLPSSTPTPTGTVTATSTSASTPTPTFTNTPVSSDTPTPTHTATQTDAPTNTATGTPTPTDTIIPPATNTPTSTPMDPDCYVYPGNGFVPSQDTWINKNQPGQSYGSDVQLHIRPVNTVDRRALIQFDLTSIPAGSTILSAVLYVNDETGENYTVLIYPITGEWNESVTWDTAPTFDPTEIGSFNLTQNPCVRAAWLDTAQVSAWVNDPSVNFGVLLYASGNSGQDLITSREGALPAKLVVEYLPLRGETGELNSMPTSFSKNY